MARRLEALQTRWSETAVTWGEDREEGIGDVALKGWAQQPAPPAWRAEPDHGDAPEVFSLYWPAFSLQVPDRKESSFLIWCGS